MKKHIDCVTINCDGCGVSFEENVYGFTIFPADQINEWLADTEWEERDGKIFCWDCILERSCEFCLEYLGTDSRICLDCALDPSTYRPGPTETSVVSHLIDAGKTQLARAYVDAYVPLEATLGRYTHDMVTRAQMQTHSELGN